MILALLLYVDVCTLYIYLQDWSLTPSIEGIQFFLCIGIII